MEPNEEVNAVTVPSGLGRGAIMIAVGIICAAIVIFLLHYVFGGRGPDPFEKDTREPLKKRVYDKKEKNKVLKQGEWKVHYTRSYAGQVSAFAFELFKSTIWLILIYICLWIFISQQTDA